ncbi:MAG: AAA family ATPase [Nitrospirae bacterium]|nr:AAA family ATPase [Nitrospirota bacterium]
MKIETLKIKNYKVFKDIEIKDMPSMCVFLGANGSGKSTLFDVFSFLSDALKDNVTIALNKRGGYKEVISREQTGDIEFEIKFRNEDDGKRGPLTTYTLKIGIERNVPIIKKEILRYRRGSYGKLWHFLDFTKGTGWGIINESDYGKEGIEEKREEQKLSSPDILAIKGLGQFQKFKAISTFRELLENWYISNFNIQASKRTQDIGISEHLSTEGENLSRVTQFIHTNHPDIFNNILKNIKERVPGVINVEAKETEDGRIVLKFHNEDFKDPFMARYVSDGTLKMFAYLILLNDPKPYQLLSIEEPENFLHPALLVELAEEFRMYGNRKSQVFISTHSPDFVNAIKLEELFWLIKENGFTTIKRAKEDPLIKKLCEAGDKLGSLWTQNYLSGSGPR